MQNWQLISFAPLNNVRIVFLSPYVVVPSIPGVLSCCEQNNTDGNTLVRKKLATLRLE